MAHRVGGIHLAEQSLCPLLQLHRPLRDQLRFWFCKSEPDQADAAGRQSQNYEGDPGKLEK